MDNIEKKVSGFKVFNPDWTCRGFQYEVGKTYEMNEKPVCCSRGFHFCQTLADCFDYYKYNPENKVAEIIALGEVDSENNDTKCCTNKIQIVREITWDEVASIVNTGKGCTGICNTGNCNTGNRNTGDWNTGNCNTGCFMTEEPKISMFNQPSDWSHADWLNSDARHLLNRMPKSVVEWVYSENMTDEEKTEHPTHETTGGYLKVLDESESGQLWWDGLTEEQKEIIKSLPNFDPKIFFVCTGIRTDGNLERRFKDAAGQEKLS